MKKSFGRAIPCDSLPIVELMLPVSVEDLIEINQLVTGGASGVLNRDHLDSALARPFQMFFGQFLYPTVAGQCGALLSGLIAAHGFTDGNKRTAWICLKIFIRLSGIAPNRVPSSPAADFVEGVATHAHSDRDIAVWIAANLFP